MHFVKPATVPLVALSLLALFTIAPAQAQFLVDPAGGTTVHSPGAEDASVRRQTGLASFSFFGTPLAPANAGETISVFVNVNGNLSLQSDAAQFRQFPNAVASIAPLFTDLSVPGNGSITEKIMTGQYYAVTYNNIKPFGQEDTNPARFSFQAVLFGQTTTIQTQNGSFTFAPNDIAFSYANTSADFPGNVGNQATVGLNRGNNSNFVPLPGDEDGTITSSQKNLLPIYSAEQNFLLFRAQGDSYSVMVVPEPGTYALFVSGTLPIAAAAAWRRRRKQAQQRGLK